MKIKRITALILALLMTFFVSACQKEEEPEVTTQENITNAVTEEAKDVVSDETQAESDTTIASEDVSETTLPDEEEKVTAEGEPSTKASENPADWSKEKIVDVYKKAAKKSNSSVKSNQAIALKKISVNNGEFEGVFDFIMPIMSKLLANNSKETAGVTGGYNNLSASDLSSAKAYKSGSNVVVEMVMKNQTSGPRENALSGSVGHAITAVGDIGVVTDQLTDLGIPLELSDKDTKIYYTKPVVKVVINNKGEIVNGTWSYTVEISMNNYKAFGKAVDTTSVIMDNTITVNGGFKK